ncbi:MAG: hypothetical protein R3Y38_07975 [Rikenellaceae bacterium]
MLIERFILEDCECEKFQDLTDEQISGLVEDIICEAILENRVFYDFDDAENATNEIFPAICELILNPRFSHVRADFKTLLETVTYLAVQLG